MREQQTGLAKLVRGFPRVQAFDRGSSQRAQRIHLRWHPITGRKWELAAHAIVVVKPRIDDGGGNGFAASTAHSPCFAVDHGLPLAADRDRIATVIAMQWRAKAAAVGMRSWLFAGLHFRRAGCRDLPRMCSLAWTT